MKILVRRAQRFTPCKCLCRGHDLDWTALNGMLQKSRLSYTAAEASIQSQELRARIGSVAQTPGLPLRAASDQHDSASSSIETRSPFVPEAPQALKVPTLGRLGAAGSMPVYTYRKAMPLPSSPVSSHLPHPPGLLWPLNFPASWPECTLSHSSAGVITLVRNFLDPGSPYKTPSGPSSITGLEDEQLLPVPEARVDLACCVYRLPRAVSPDHCRSF